jgi:hypothetical protein
MLKISISYLDEFGRNTSRRGKRFFSGEEVTTELWLKEAVIALSEYFNVVEEVLESYPSDSSSPVLKRYLDCWLKEAPR